MGENAWMQIEERRLSRRKMLTWSARLGVGAAGLALVGCGDEDDDEQERAVSEPEPEPIAVGAVARVDTPRHPADTAATGSGAAALSAFATDLYAVLTADHDNLVFSPYSAAIALAMTRVGAAGETAQQMDAVLHADRATDLNAGFNAFEQALAQRAGAKTRADGSTATLELSTANALWGQQEFTFLQPFLTTLAADYGAGMRLVDYRTDFEGARQTINAWVADQTRERIPDLIPPDVLNELTRLVLTNAIYLKAPWEVPFDESATRDGPFHRLDGSEVTVPRMALNEQLRYTAGDGYQAVELPYAGRELAMLVLVPDEGRFPDVEDALNAALIDDTVTRLRPLLVELRFPRFTFRTSALLADALTALGMPLAFREGQADFSAITDEARLFIRDVIHEAFIAVDEEGTEAAAATAIVVQVESALPEPIRLTVDRPFIFLIRDVQTGAILFLGRVLDASA